MLHLTVIPLISTSCRASIEWLSIAQSSSSFKGPARTSRISSSVTEFAVRAGMAICLAWYTIKIIIKKTTHGPLILHHGESTCTITLFSLEFWCKKWVLPPVVKYGPYGIVQIEEQEECFCLNSLVLLQVAAHRDHHQLQLPVTKHLIFFLPIFNISNFLHNDYSAWQ